MSEQTTQIPDVDNGQTQRKPTRANALDLICQHELTPGDLAALQRSQGGYKRIPEDWIDIDSSHVDEYRQAHRKLRSRLRGLDRIEGSRIPKTLQKLLPQEGFRSWAVHLSEAANVARLGVQLYDAEGEALIALVPADWTGWKWVELDLSGESVEQAYEQADKNGEPDYPLKSVHVAWFTKAAGATSLTVDAVVSLGVTPVTTAIFGVTVPQYSSLLATPEPTEKCVIVSEPLVASTKSIFATGETLPVATVQPPLVRATATRT